ncbi:MAG: sodium:calcium antiporter, partial [Opitutales bacterium]
MSLALLELQYSAFPVWLLLAFLVVGLLCLTFGGDWLTCGAAAISVNLKINPVIVGLTVVSMATSMPELVTSLLAARESPGLAIGNILGSNVANMSLILGITALIAPLAIQLRLIRREVPILIVVTILFSVFAIGGFARWEGVVLLCLTVAYLVYVVRGARSEPDVVNAEFMEEVEEASQISVGKASWLVLIGAVLLALGTESLVSSSVELASRMGISDALIGLTIV